MEFMLGVFFEAPSQEFADSVQESLAQFLAEHWRLRFLLNSVAPPMPASLDSFPDLAESIFVRELERHGKDLLSSV